MHIYGKQIRGHINTYMEFYASMYRDVINGFMLFYDNEE